MDSLSFSEVLIVVVVIFLIWFVRNDYLVRKAHSKTIKEISYISYIYEICKLNFLNALYCGSLSKGNVLDEYKITESSEIDSAFGIVEKYKDYMISKFLKGTLAPIPDYYVYKGEKYYMTDTEYYARTLYSYMEEHLLDFSFNNNQMYYVKSRRAKCGDFRFDEICELTDYAVIYHKLFYALEVYLGISYSGGSSVTLNCIDAKEVHITSRNF